MFSKRDMREAVRVVNSILASKAYEPVLCSNLLIFQCTKSCFAAKNGVEYAKKDFGKREMKASEGFLLNYQTFLSITRSGV